MRPGSPTNWPASPASPAFWETVDSPSLENLTVPGVARQYEALRKHSLVRTVSSSQYLQPISASIVVPISNFDALNPWNKIREEVETWSNLKADWDDEAAVIPRSDGLKFLEMIINRFKDEGSPNAMPYIAGDGEFGLHWRLRGGKAVLSILADGRVLAFCPRRSGDPIRIKSTLDQQIDMKAFYSALREIAQ